MFKNLVLAGGGIKLICILGAIKFLEECNYLQNIEKLYANSAGAIISLQIILGYTSSEIIDFYNKFELEKLLVLNIENVFTDFCIYENHKLEKLIKLFISFKYGAQYENITLLELFNKSNKYFSISTVSLGKKKVIHLTHLNYPDLYVWKAILMSTSIPLAFKPIEYDTDLFVDGGLLENFPFSSIPVSELNQTLGLQVLLEMEEEEVICEDITEYMMHILKIIFNRNNIYNENYKIITIKIKDDRIKHLLDFNLTIQDKEVLIDYGYEQVKNSIDLLNNIQKDIGCQTCSRQRSFTI
jgi:NTE family protein